MHNPLSLLSRHVAAKVLVVAAAVFIVELGLSLFHSHRALKQQAEAFVMEEVSRHADLYFDRLNKLMLTGGMEARGGLRREFLSSSNILEARVIRGPGVSGQYGPGRPEEAAADALDGRALAGEEVRIVQTGDGGRRLTLIRPYRASENTRGVNCLTCHQVASGTVLGAVRITYDLGPVDAGILATDLENAAIHGITFGLGFGLMIWLMLRFVSRPVKGLAATMAGAQAHSDLSLRIPTQSNDEIGQAALAFNAMLERFGTMLQQVRATAHDLAHAMQRLTQSAGESEAGARHQLESTEELVQVLYQMAASAQEVAARIQEAATAAKSADDLAHAGALTATEALGSIEVMSEQLRGAVQVIRRLDEDTREVSQVLGLIREIAEQTNLLALNAAIEAARAGEAGRGFAVVADEVRTLAGRTQAATRDIERILGKVREASQEAVGVIQEAEAQSAGGVEHVEKTAEALAEIAGAVGRINSMTDQVATHAREQGQSAARIGGRIEAIRKVAGQAARTAQEVRAVSEELKAQADGLQAGVDQFRL